eukprot:scaffold96021_cov31-Prasinocladus_malaysianus.AAC.1
MEENGCLVGTKEAEDYLKTKLYLPEELWCEETDMKPARHRPTLWDSITSGQKLLGDEWEHLFLQ